MFSYARAKSLICIGAISLVRCWGMTDEARVQGFEPNQWCFFLVSDRKRVAKRGGHSLRPPENKTAYVLTNRLRVLNTYEMCT